MKAYLIRATIAGSLAAFLLWYIWKELGLVFFSIWLASALGGR